MPKIPGALDAAGAAPHPQAVRFRSPLSAQIGGGVAVAGVAVAEVLAIGKGLPPAHHPQVHVLPAPDDLGHGAAVAVGVHHLQGHL